MFIVLQEPGDTMVLDTTQGHQVTCGKLVDFLASSQTAVEISAASPCPAYPEAKTVRTFRMVKTSGLILTQRLPESVLQVSGRPELLERYARAFHFEPEGDGGHRHPEQMFWGELDPRSDMIIVEVEDDLDDPDAWLPPK